MLKWPSLGFLRRRRLSRFAITWIVVSAVVLIATAVLADRWALVTATAQTRRTATARAVANAGYLASELQKFYLLPLVLSEHPDVNTALEGTDQNGLSKLSLKLESLAARTDAAVIFVANRHGLVIAASNAALPTSFVGQDSTLRPYFKETMLNGSAEYFALGVVTRRPGLFLARRVAGDLGMIVVKIEFGHLEDIWARQTGPTLVRDRYGIVTVSSEQDWLLRAAPFLGHNGTQKLEANPQFGSLEPAALPFQVPSPTGEEQAVTLPSGKRYVPATVVVPFSNWTLTSLEPLGPALAATKTTAQVATLVVALSLLVVFGAVLRSWEKRQLRIAAEAELENEVKLRTAELRGANERLMVASVERERADSKLRKAREELAQANRLASIGQITTGIAHEVNQPVTAIRTFAENCIVMLSRGDTKGADGNLHTIVDLTARIGRITGELRSFARRSSAPMGPTSLDAALDGALLLVGDRLRVEEVTLTRTSRSQPPLQVLADHSRLEQVLVNLLQNAMDALTGVAHPQIDIEVDGDSDPQAVTIVVADSGTGIPEALRHTLFKPFVTGKEGGLGLGLGIARDIVRDYRGELGLVSSKLGGAAFSIRLRRP